MVLWRSIWSSRIRPLGPTNSALPIHLPVFQSPVFKEAHPGFPNSAGVNLRRGTLLEIPIVIALYGIGLALLFPRFYRSHNLWGLGLLWLVGLGLTRLMGTAWFDQPRTFLKVPLYLWAFALLSLIPAACLKFDFPPGFLLLLPLPYLAVRSQLWFQR